MRAFAPIYPQPLGRIAQALCLLSEDTDETKLALSAADAVSGLVGQLGLPQHLRDVGIDESELPTIAATTPNREFSTEELEKLLHDML
jgi:alcohol dehydrogenase class IV